MSKKPTRKPSTPTRASARGTAPAATTAPTRARAVAPAVTQPVPAPAAKSAAKSKAKPSAATATTAVTPPKAKTKLRAARRKAPSRMRRAKFAVGQVVRHRFYPFRGVVFDIDPVFNNTEEWWEAIPEEIRPVKDQPFYHLLAENAETEYIAYVSEQNLLADDTGEPLRHPKIGELFTEENGQYRAIFLQSH